jgi:hypothetical protein
MWHNEVSWIVDIVSEELVPPCSRYKSEPRSGRKMHWAGPSVYQWCLGIETYLGLKMKEGRKGNGATTGPIADGRCKGGAKQLLGEQGRRKFSKRNTSSRFYLLSVQRRFGRPYCLHLQGRRVSHAKPKGRSGKPMLFLLVSWFFSLFTHEEGGSTIVRNVDGLNSCLHGVTSQYTTPFIVAIVRTSDPKYFLLL